MFCQKSPVHGVNSYKQQHRSLVQLAPPTNVCLKQLYIKEQMGIIRKDHIRRPQTNPGHSEEKTHNTDGHITIKLEQSSKMITKLQRTPRTTRQNKDSKQNPGFF